MLKNTFKKVSIFYCIILSYMLVYSCKEDKELERTGKR